MRGWLILILLTLGGCSQMSGYHAQSSRASNTGLASSTDGNSVETTRPASACDGGQYTVKRNDTLSHIALRCGVSLRALAQANQLKRPYVIHPGQVLIVPQSTQRGVPSQSSRPTVAKTPVSGQWHWPIANASQFAYITDSAGLKGLEVYVDVGEDVLAVASGEVVYAENSISNFGLMVIIRHSHDYLTVYAHNQQLFVTKGDRVESGQRIAHSGRSGTTERPKLYFEARHQGRKIHADRLWPERR